MKVLKYEMSGNNSHTTRILGDVVSQRLPEFIALGGNEQASSAVSSTVDETCLIRE